MNRRKEISHEFVEFVPAELASGVLYVSFEYGTASHLCCCGCGNKVVTPLSPTDWRVIFDGESVSLDPSIGNWSFDCQSHYWIVRGKVRWAGMWSRERIDNGRHWDTVSKEAYFEAKQNSEDYDPPARRESLWRRLKDWW
jgi:hypothetical protein